MPENIFFSRLAEDELPDSSILDISSGGKVLIISDLHMGCGSRDDLYHNGDMLTCLLEEFYFKNGWILVLNGDIEELQRYSFDSIWEKWKKLYRVFSLFAEDNRLYKIAGNHDEQLLLKRQVSNPYNLHSVIKIETGTVPAYVYHGHQLSAIYVKFNRLFGIAIRYILTTFGIKNLFSARSPSKRFHIEKKAYAFSLKNNCLSIIGHT
ncbi:MAG: metallophosphoesterase, partial [Treponema sp.]|nr:metallophosphoesterase [Treponema sp.]